MTGQLTEKDHTIRDLQTLNKRMDFEKQELQSALEEAGAAIEESEQKAQRAQQEIPEVKEEIERRIAEKESDFENTR